MEPLGFAEKLLCIWQNSFEIISNVLIMIFAQFNASFVSAFFIASSQILVLATTLPADRRLMWDQIILSCNLMALAAVVVAKRSLDQAHQCEDGGVAYAEAVAYYQSLGFVVESGGPGEFKVLPWLSYRVEAFMAIIYIVAMYTACSLSSARVLLARKKKDVLLIRFFDACAAGQVHQKQLEALRAPAAGVGLLASKSMTQEAEQSRRRRIKQFRKYHEKIRELKDKTPRYFLGSAYYCGLNKSFFACLVILQLIQSTGFSSMFDVPQLFMLMLLASFFMFREKMRLAFGRFSFFLVSYIQVAVLLKILYQVIIKCTWAVQWIGHSQNKEEAEVIKAFFGGGHTKFGTLKEASETILYEISLLGCFVFAHLWKIAKTAQYRMFTQHFKEDATDQERFEAAVKREKILTFKKRMKSFVELYNKGKGEASQMETKIFDADALTAAKSGFASSFGPALVVWSLRFTLGLQAYMYHNFIGLLHLTWILLSFIFSARTTLLLSSAFMVPLYTFEFIVVYGCQLQVIQDIDFFKKYGQYFVTDMKRPILEQNLYFLNLLLWYMTIGSLKLAFDRQGSGSLGRFFAEKIHSKSASVIWKLLFLALRYI